MPLVLVHITTFFGVFVHAHLFNVVFVIYKPQLCLVEIEYQ